MDASLPVSVHPDDCVRMIAALANSGGGCFSVDTNHEQGRKALAAALTDIVPQPVLSGIKQDDTQNEKRLMQINSFVCPAHLSVREVETGLIITVTPGDSFCTFKGDVIVVEDGDFRTLTITDVVRRSGSGG